MGIACRVGAMTLACGMLMMIDGCATNSNNSGESNQPPASSASEAPLASTPADDASRADTSHASVYDGPPVSVRVSQEKRLPPISTATVEVRVPTGGWELAIDRTEIDDNTAHIYATLQRPGQGDMVTQALETLHVSFRSEHPPFEHAHVYINMTRRGEAQASPNYQRAATTFSSGSATSRSAQSNAARTKPDLPRVNPQPYERPRPQVELLQMESHPVQYAAAVAITVPTGGWMLNLDQGEVIDSVAKIFLTLEAPGADEIVTQALEKHRALFTSHEPFDRAEIYIHRARRDIHTLTTDYRLAAEVP